MKSRKNARATRAIDTESGCWPRRRSNGDNLFLICAPTDRSGTCVCKSGFSQEPSVRRQSASTDETSNYCLLYFAYDFLNRLLLIVTEDSSGNIPPQRRHSPAAQENLQIKPFISAGINSYANARQFVLSGTTGFLRLRNQQLGDMQYDQAGI